MQTDVLAALLTQSWQRLRIQQVMAGFDGRSTRDGNVSGRFLGYARSKWSKNLELDDAT